MDELEHKDSAHYRHTHPKGPNFGMVVIAAGVALIVVFIIALIVLVVRGKKDMPLNHTHKDRNALVRRPPAGGVQAIAARLDVAFPVAFASGMTHQG